MFTSSMPNLYAADFYRDVIGFEQTFQFPPAGPPEHVELRLGESMLALSSHPAVRQMGLPAPSAGHTQELVVWCDDMDAAIARLRAARAPVLVEPYDHVAGHRRPTSPIPTATGWPSSRSNFRVTGQWISFAWAASRLVAGARPVMDPRFTRAERTPPFP